MGGLLPPSADQFHHLGFASLPSQFTVTFNVVDTIFPIMSTCPKYWTTTQVKCIKLLGATSLQIPAARVKSETKQQSTHSTNASGLETKSNSFLSQWCSILFIFWSYKSRNGLWLSDLFWDSNNLKWHKLFLIRVRPKLEKEFPGNRQRSSFGFIWVGYCHFH